MRFLLPLFLPFLLILYCSLQPGSSALLYEQVYANESIPAFSLPIVASDSASPGGEGNSNNAKPIEDLDKLSDKDLRAKKDQAEDKLTKLNATINDKKSTLKKKQDDAKGRLQKKYDETNGEWKRLDGIANGMNKELEEATDEHTIADRESRLANKTYSDYENAIAKLEKAKKLKKKVDGCAARLPVARLEKTDWTNKCDILEIKGSLELNRELTAAKRVAGGAQKNVNDQQAIVNACSTDCKLKQDQLDEYNNALTLANTELGKAQEAVDTLEQCPAKKESLEEEVEALEKIEQNPNAAVEAQQAIEKAESESKDARFDGILEKRDKATQALIDAESTKAAAEATAKTPAEVEEAREAARLAKMAFDEADGEKKQVESEISELETAIPQLEKTLKEEETEVAALQTAYARRSTEEKTGMGALSIAGIGIACLVLLVVVGGLVYFKFYHNKKGPKDGKGAEAKEQLESLIKANSNSAVQAPNPTPLPEPLPANAPSAPPAQSAAPVLATEKAAVPAPKEEPIEPFATASVEGLHQRLATVPDDVPDQDLRKAIAIVKKDAAPDSFVHYYNDYNALVFKPKIEPGMDYGPSNMKRLQIGTGLTSTCQDGRKIRTGYMDLDPKWRPPKFNNLPSNDFNKEEAYKFVHKYDGDAAAAASVKYEDPRTPEVHQYNKDDAMRKLDERKDMRRIAERNKRMGSGRSEREDDTESTEHIVPGQEYDLIKYFHYEESRFEMIKGYPKLVKGIRRGDKIPPGYITEITKIEEVESEEAENKKEAAESDESPSHSDKLQPIAYHWTKAPRL